MGNIIISKSESISANQSLSIALYQSTNTPLIIQKVIFWVPEGVEGSLKFQLKVGNITILPENNSDYIYPHHKPVELNLDKKVYLNFPLLLEVTNEDLDNNHKIFFIAQAEEVNE